jgi:hypothetical protein
VIYENARKLDKVILTIVLVFLALLIGYALGKTAAPSLNNLDQHLEGISSSLDQLTKALCGDKRLERAIEETNEVGATLSEEELAYDGGSLKRIEYVIGNLAARVESLAEAAKKNQQ